MGVVQSCVIPSGASPASEGSPSSLNGQRLQYVCHSLHRGTSLLERGGLRLIDRQQPASGPAQEQKKATEF
eukprot:1315138-Prorocentrum_lima.AAC.1